MGVCDRPVGGHDARERVVCRDLPPPRGRLAERAAHLRHDAEAIGDASEAKVVAARQEGRLVEDVHTDGAAELGGEGFDALRRELRRRLREGDGVAARGRTLALPAHLALLLDARWQLRLRCRRLYRRRLRWRRRRQRWPRPGRLWRHPHRALVEVPIKSPRLERRLTTLAARRLSGVRVQLRQLHAHAARRAGDARVTAGTPTIAARATLTIAGRGAAALSLAAAVRVLCFACSRTDIEVRKDGGLGRKVGTARGARDLGRH
mmetsp:Transcript_37591/g.112164  ORF Transcript_37591/g.112164 Transcript_37591/m.112164 type:complete len:263 (+) Transcript_37591:191-979(+)